MKNSKITYYLVMSLLLILASCHGLLGHDTMHWYGQVATFHFTLKMEAAWPSKTLVSYHIIAWCLQH